ncbi:hypothetical protein ABBQ38_008092 [Trebouxia sp. C0009 RCD-2024]
MNDVSLLQRQLDEIDALLATFPESGAASFTPAEQSVLEASRRRLDSAAFASYQSQLSGSVSLLDVQLEGSPVGVHYTLPHDYPDCAPRIQVHCAAGRHAHEQLTHAVQQAVQQNSGTECLLLVVDALQEEALKLQQDAQDHADAESIASQEQLDLNSRPIQLGRRSIWFHHIKSLTKRKHILAWGKELKLGGYSKPGYPGVIICEGAEEDAAEFVHRLRELRWKAMAVRGEEQIPLQEGQKLDSARRFSSHQITELDEGGMSELASICKTAELEQLFLTAMKITK